MFNAIKEEHALIQKNKEMYSLMNLGFAEFQKRLEVVEGAVDDNTRRIASLEEENEKLRDENVKLKARLDKIEKHLGL